MPYPTFAPVLTGAWIDAKRKVSDLVKWTIDNIAFTRDAVIISGGIPAETPLGALMTKTGVWDGTDPDEVYGLLLANLPKDDRALIGVPVLVRMAIIDPHQIQWPAGVTDSVKTEVMDKLAAAHIIPIEPIIRAEYDFMYAAG